jgi:hypothetical protein
MFCEALEPSSILPHLPALMTGLTALISSHGTPPGVLDMALGAVSSTAGAAGARFAPYVGESCVPVVDL